MRKLSIACIASMIILVILHVLVFNTPETAMFSWLYIIPLILAVIELVALIRQDKGGGLLCYLLGGVVGVASVCVATLAILSLFNPPATPPAVEQGTLDDTPTLEQTSSPEQINSSEQDDDTEQENEFWQPSQYTEEQLAALGKVMVCGDFVGFSFENADTDLAGVAGVITFVDEDFGFAAFGHGLGEYADREFFGGILNFIITSHSKDGIEEDLDDSEIYIAFLSDSFYDKNGFYGRMSDFIYNPAKEMGFGLPTAGAAQIYLEMPDGRSDWYEIEIFIIHEDGEFSFLFNDKRLPDGFYTYDMDGRSGSPIIQRGEIVGAVARDFNFHYAGFAAVLAADMRFAQLQRYDENFDSELFRDVPTLKHYFD